MFLNNPVRQLDKQIQQLRAQKEAAEAKASAYSASAAGVASAGSGLTAILPLKTIVSCDLLTALPGAKNSQ